MNEKLHPLHITILVYMIQSGVAILSLPQVLANRFGYNGWLSLIPLSCIVMLNIFLISCVYRLGRGQSIFAILEGSIHRFILNPFYIGIALLWGLIGCMVAKQYIMIYQMAAFPTTSPMLFKFLFDMVLFLFITKGIYNISKAATVFFWMISWMLLLLLVFFQDLDWSRLSPFIFQGETQMLKGSIEVYSAFIGLELCMLFFPYVEKRGFIKSIFMANAWTTFTYLIVSIVSFAFYSLGQLKLLAHPTLELLAYIRFPFIEHIENLLLGFILLSIVITSGMFIWGSKEALLRIFPNASNKGLTLIILVVIFMVSWIPKSLAGVEKWLEMLVYFEIGLSFILPTFLILLLFIQRKRGGRIHA